MVFRAPAILGLATPAIRRFSESVRHDITSSQYKYEQHLKRLKDIPLPWTNDSQKHIAEYGSGFLDPSNVSRVLPSYSAAKSYIKTLLETPDADLNILDIKYFLPDIYSEFLDEKKRTNQGLRSFNVSFNTPNNALLLSDMFVQQHPILESLITEAVAVVDTFKKRNAPRTHITSTFVAYRLSWPSYTNPSHRDGVPAIHIPLLLDGCTGTTVFSDSSLAPTKTLEDTDKIALTDDKFFHEICLNKTDPNDRRRVLSRLVLNVR